MCEKQRHTTVAACLALVAFLPRVCGHLAVMAVQPVDLQPWARDVYTVESIPTSTSRWVLAVRAIAQVWVLTAVGSNNRRFKKVSAFILVVSNKRVAAEYTI